MSSLSDEILPAHIIPPSNHLKDSFIGLLSGINGNDFLFLIWIENSGGIATVCVGQPLDTLKVKMQTFPEVYSSAWRCLKVTLAKDGIRHGLYAGTVPALVANVAENSVLFCALAPSQHLVGLLCQRRHGEHLSILEHACAGSLAAFWSSLALCPTELVKCKVQSLREMMELSQLHSKSSSIGPWAVTKSIYAESGFSGFTRGLGATFAREMPGYFCFFGGYEACRSIFASRGVPKEDLGSVATMISGGMGGVAFWLAIFPFDVVKSRMQIGHTEAACSSGNSTSDKGLGLIKLLPRIIKHEGIGALYRGLGPTLLRTFPASAALFLTVEWTKKFCHWLSD